VRFSFTQLPNYPITKSPCLPPPYVSQIIPERRGFQRLFGVPITSSPDVPITRSGLPPPQSSQNGVGFRGIIPRSSKIGAHFSDSPPIGVGLRASLHETCGEFPKVKPYHPHPGVDAFVASKSLVQSDRPVTERSKPFFCLVSRLNRLALGGCQVPMAKSQ
jgi:hypothetical protein